MLVKGLQLFSIGYLNFFRIDENIHFSQIAFRFQFMNIEGQEPFDLFLYPPYLYFLPYMSLCNRILDIKLVLANVQTIKCIIEHEVTMNALENVGILGRMQNSFCRYVLEKDVLIMEYIYPEDLQPIGVIRDHNVILKKFHFHIPFP